MKKKAVSIIIILLILGGCATASLPSTQTLPLPNQNKTELFKHVSKSLLMAGYEIKTKDEETGVIQAFRPMKGAFTRPGYGHNVSISIEDNVVKVTAFAMEGVAGGESPEEIKNEVLSIIRK